MQTLVQRIPLFLAESPTRGSGRIGASGGHRGSRGGRGGLRAWPTELSSASVANGDVEEAAADKSSDTAGLFDGFMKVSSLWRVNATKPLSSYAERVSRTGQSASCAECQARVGGLSVWNH